MRRSAAKSGFNFAQVPTIGKTERSKMDRSSLHKTSFDAGYLIPIFWEQVYPGDTFTIKMNAFCRMTTPLKPIMDSLKLTSHWFYAPDRILWEHFVNFMGEKETPDDETEYLEPQVRLPDNAAGGAAVHSIADYLGLPTGPGNATNGGIYSNAALFRMYNKIYNAWYRDQNLIDPVPENIGDGPDTYTDFVLQKRAKRPDYFTTCLPSPQKGPEIGIGLAGTAEINPLLDAGNHALPTFKSYAYGDNNGTIMQNASDTKLEVQFNKRAGDVLEWNNPALYADLTTATAITINQLRIAFQLQKLYERDMRGGTRYPEIVKQHFDVTTDDGRLQRPEYLGGGSSFLNVHPIAQMSSSTETSKQGDVAAFATLAAENHGFTRSFNEHGWIMGIICVHQTDYCYQQGINRQLTTRTRLDRYWVETSHLGEQAVLSKEIYCDGSEDDNLVFGYQERFAELRYKPSIISGRFRSTDALSMDNYHLAPEFGSRPELGQDFIEENPPMERILAVEGQPHFFGDFYFNEIAIRPMPLYSVPGLIDHL